MFRTKKTPEQVWPSFSNWPKLMKVALITAIALLISQLLTDGLFLISNLSSKTYQVDVFYWAARLLISAVALGLSILGISRTAIFLFVFNFYLLGNSLLLIRGLPDVAFVTFTEIFSVETSVSGSMYSTVFASIGICLIYCQLTTAKLVTPKTK